MALIPEFESALLNAVVNDQLATFERHMGDERLTREVELCALGVAWLAVGLPWAIDEGVQPKLKDLIARCEESPSFEWSGFWRVAALRVALFALTDEYQHIREVLRHMATGQANVREYIMQCIALVANRLDFDDGLLDRQTDLCLRHHVIYAEQAASIRLTAAGRLGAKLRWVSEELKEFHNLDTIRVLKDAALGYVPNVFPGLGAEIASFVSTRLIAVHPSANERQDSRASAFTVGHLFWNEIREHPLLRSSFHLERRLTVKCEAADVCWGQYDAVGDTVGAMQAHLADAGWRAVNGRWYCSSRDHFPEVGSPETL